MLTAEELDQFLSLGFVRIRGAVEPENVLACREVIWGELAKLGMLESDPASWTSPLARFPTPDGGPFIAAATGSALSNAYDQLIGPGRWERPQGVGGNLFVRFPSEEDPLKTKWHIDGGFVVGEEWRNNIRCRGKGLLALFLFSDITDVDAPTQLLPGSHFDIAGVLEPVGEAGLSFDEICRQIPSASLEREVVTVTGMQGDVYLCHPLLVHSPSWPHRGRYPRMLAQPGVGLLEPFALTDPAAAFPVERAIIEGLERARSAATSKAHGGPPLAGRAA